jgi:hypothetical protein
MNYLAHHAIARQRSANTPEISSFFVGNVLPDLLGISGDGKLRAVHVKLPTTALERGIRLHIETDRAFHGLAAFLNATSQAKEILLEAPFRIPVHRVFFIAHVFVELALDAYLLNKISGIAEDFYGKFDSSNTEQIVEETRRILGVENPLPSLPRTIERFRQTQFLYRYRTEIGLADSLDGLSRRAGLPGFGAEDRGILAACFTEFQTNRGDSIEDLLALP